MNILTDAEQRRRAINEAALAAKELEVRRNYGGAITIDHDGSLQNVADKGILTIPATTYNGGVGDEMRVKRIHPTPDGQGVERVEEFTVPVPQGFRRLEQALGIEVVPQVVQAQSTFASNKRSDAVEAVPVSAPAAPAAPAKGGGYLSRFGGKK